MKTKKNFESAMTELEEIISGLQNTETTLDDALKMYKKSVDLVKYCQGKLDKAKLDIEIYGEGEENGEISNSI